MPFPISFNCSIVDFLKMFEPEVRNILCPGKKKAKIISEMKRLMKNKEATVKCLLELEKSETCKPEVSDWLQTVEDVNKEVGELLEKLRGRRTRVLSFCCCCCSCKANYELGETTDELLRQIDVLKEERGKWEKDDDLVKKKKIQTAKIEDNNQGMQNQLQDPWQMFLEQLGGNETTLKDLRKMDLAKAIVEECKSSQEEEQILAIRAVGQTVKNYSLVSDWENALQQLRNPPWQIGITPKIEIILRFCYDELKNPQLRSCLSYCILFRDNNTICENDLITGWIGEGVLDDVNVDSAYQEGQRVIEKLKATFMLESSSWCDFYLRINDRVRFMVRQTQDGEEGSGSLIDWTRRHESVGDLQLWGSKARVSLKEDFIKSLPNRTEAFSDDGIPKDTPVCTSLITLLLGGSKHLKRIHEEFFRFIPALRVLNLSNTIIDKVPSSVGLLQELRCLNLKGTKIRMLSPELGKLRNLRILDLNDTKELTKITHESISGLSMLQVLHMSNCGYTWNPTTSNGDGDHHHKLLNIEDLGDLKRIKHLWITVRSTEILELVLGLQSSMIITGLTLKGKEFTENHLCKAFSSLPRLQWAELGRCVRVEGLVIGRKQLLHLQELKLSSLGLSRILSEEKVHVQQFLPNLRHVGIYDCDSLKDLTWLGQLAKLELVCVQSCKGVTELISRRGACSVNGMAMTNICDENGPDTDDNGLFFPNLQFLVLHTMPKLRSFSWRHPLRLPSLRTLRIKHCPMLIKLPFGCESCKGIKEIKGTREWWNGLQWDNDEIKQLFLHHFRPCN